MRIILIILSILFFTESYAQLSFVKGEELKYEVSYGFIKLGSVNFKIENIRDSTNGIKVIDASALIKSYEGAPFITIDDIFKSRMIYDKGSLYAKEFTAIQKSKNETKVISYKFDYDNKKIDVSKKLNNNAEEVTHIDMKGERYNDGLSIFYASRFWTKGTSQGKDRIFINDQDAEMTYAISNGEDISTDVSDKDIKTKQITGNSGFSGFFGLTGEFIGWFSKDLKSIPLMAKLDIALGSVSVELIETHNAEWDSMN